MSLSVGYCLRFFKFSRLTVFTESFTHETGRLVHGIVQGSHALNVTGKKIKNIYIYIMCVCVCVCE